MPKSRGPGSLLNLIQARTAEIAIGPSTLRNQGASSVIANARGFLKELDLGHFSVDTATAFRGALDEETKNLQSALPLDARHWAQPARR